MSRIPKSLVKLAVIASLIVILAFLVVRPESWDTAWRFNETDLAAKNAELTHENELLELKIADLINENATLKKYLLAYETNFIALRDAAANCGPIEPGPAADLPEGLRREPVEIRRIYRDLLGETMRWNRYQQEQYKHIIDSTVEPHIVEAQTLYLENEDNREYFLELEYAFRLLYEQQQDTTASPVPTTYNYNLYTVYGKKLMEYSETLAPQSSITLEPSAFGQLDFFNRRMYDGLYDLYQLGQDEAIDPSHLDLAELEEVLDAKF